ncbi:SDR family oxidoreductase [Streptomyces sp. AN091965]|uniref:SDR family oxidoreductase n=1 Tax=Streptomyces sp. AN091965 TaxID=2927803 RepID=UPI0035A98D88
MCPRDILSTAIEAGTWCEAALQPVNRTGRPTEVAEALTWLASPAAPCVTGTVLNVDGGYKAQQRSAKRSRRPYW